MVQVRVRRALQVELEAECFRYLWAIVPPGVWIIRRGKLSIEMFTPTTISAASVLTNRKVGLAILLVASILAINSCAALEPPNATGPRGANSPYPVLLTEDSTRREAIAIAVNRLAQLTGNTGAAQAELQPVTATILSLPPNATGKLFLPKVGVAAVMSEEETRESLRRFIKEWQQLIGSDPTKLSLVERVDQPDGLKLANYEQRPFRYPLRGNYGKLRISFTADRRIVSLTSSCVPDAERIQTSLPAFSSVRLKAEDAAQQLRNNGLAYTDPKGNQTNTKLLATSDIRARGLVIYVLPSKKQADALEFHLAWEMELGNAPVKIAYLDAISGEIIAVE
jgi:hypothetical protein